MLDAASLGSISSSLDADAPRVVLVCAENPIRIEKSAARSFRWKIGYAIHQQGNYIDAGPG